MPRKAVGRQQHPKARHDLIPPNALHQVALAFAYGEEKHKGNPKEKGRSWRGEFAALMRHAWAPVRGDFYDPETKLCHWAHAVARGLILLEFFITEVGTDDLTPGKQKEKSMRRKISSGVRVLLGTAMAFVFLLATLALTAPASAFEANPDDDFLLKKGEYLLQWDHEKPELCRTRARAVSLVLEEYPDARIERHELANGTMWLFADYGDLTGEIFALRPDGLVCQSYPLAWRSLFAVMRLVHDPARKFKVLPVWPAPED